MVINILKFIAVLILTFLSVATGYLIGYNEGWNDGHSVGVIDTLFGFEAIN